MGAFHLRLRFNGKHIIAFVSSSKIRRLVEASSNESVLRDGEGKSMSLDAAELVGRALAERMKQKYVLKAKFDIGKEYSDKDPKFHEHVLTIAEALSQNGIRLF